MAASSRASSVLIPRLSTTVSLQDIDRAIMKAFRTLGYESPTWVQEEAVRAFIMGRDVFVIVPTGSGKSLCFLALPLVFDSLCSCNSDTDIHHSTVLVIGPLTALMKDQVSKYGAILRCAFIGEDCDSDGILQGNYQVVYVSPETILQVAEWREMLRSSVYRENTVAVAVDEAHCICTW